MKIKKIRKIWAKGRTVLLEIGIVFIGVLLAAVISDFRTKSIERKEAKDFLISLSDEIFDDVNEIQQIMDQFVFYDSLYKYLSELNPSNFEREQFDSAFHFSQGNIWLKPNVSLYDGFKSSGKLNTIKNKTILQSILFFYQEALPQLKASENGWLNLHNQYQMHIMENVSYDDDGQMNSLDIITSSKGKFLTKALIPSPQLFDRYSALQDMGEKIIIQIDKEYNLKKTMSSE